MISNPHEKAWLGIDLTGRSTRLCCSSARAFIAFTVFWSVVELPWELETTQSAMASAALVCAKLLFIVVATLTFLNVKWASLVYVMICALSILAISPSLLVELKVLQTGFVLSAVEVCAKAGCLVTMSGWMRKTSNVVDSVRTMRDVRYSRNSSGDFRSGLENQE